jgi:Fe-S oxidoreductase
MDFATSEGHFASSPKGKDTCEYAFYPGCQLGAFNPDHVLKSYDFLARTHDAGIILGCCGAPAYWAGDEVRLRENAEETRRQWSEMGKPTLVFACATCESLFALFMPEIARVSLYELLALADTNELPAAPIRAPLRLSLLTVRPCSILVRPGMTTRCSLGSGRLRSGAG